MPTPLEVYRSFQKVLLTNDFARLPEAQALLAHFDTRSQHYEVKVDALQRG